MGSIGLGYVVHLITAQLKLQLHIVSLLATGTDVLLSLILLPLLFYEKKKKNI